MQQPPLGRRRSASVQERRYVVHLNQQVVEEWTGWLRRVAEGALFDQPLILLQRGLAGITVAQRVFGSVVHLPHCVPWRGGEPCEPAMVFESWPLGLCSPVGTGVLCERLGLLELEVELHERAARLQGVVTTPNQFERTLSPSSFDRGDGGAAVVAGLPTQGALGQVLPLPQAARLAAELPGRLSLSFVEGFHLSPKQRMSTNVFTSAPKS